MVFSYTNLFFQCWCLFNLAQNKPKCNFCSYHFQTHGGNINIKEVFQGFSLDTISNCAFGIETNSFKNPGNELFRVRIFIDRTIFENKASLRNFFLQLLIQLKPREWSKAGNVTDATNNFILSWVQRSRAKQKVQRIPLALLQPCSGILFMPATLIVNP